MTEPAIKLNEEVKEEPKETKRTNIKDLEARVEYLETQLEKVTDAFVKMAHYSGRDNIVREHHLETWKPGRNDMRKYRD